MRDQLVSLRLPYRLGSLLTSYNYFPTYNYLTYHPLPSTYHLLPTTYHLPPTTYHLPTYLPTYLPTSRYKTGPRLDTYR